MSTTPEETPAQAERAGQRQAGLDRRHQVAQEDYAHRRHCRREALYHLFKETVKAGILTNAPTPEERRAADQRIMGIDLLDDEAEGDLILFRDLRDLS